MTTTVLEPAPKAASHPNPMLAATTLRNAEVAVDVRGATKAFVTGPSILRRLRGDRIPRKRVVAVDDITLEVRRGEIFGILGPNGTGKSTLIRLMSTLLFPDSGCVSIFGYHVSDDEMMVKRLINRVSVEASFFKKLSPMENLLYGARLYSLDARVARVRIKQILKRLGLEDGSVNSPMEDMSRGMQQKVAIARAFLSAPIVLLLDEPTTGLDPHSKREVQAFIREIRDTHDATVLLTTHDMEEADELCDRIAIIDHGGIVALDTPAALKDRVRGEKHPDPSLEDVFLELTGKSFDESDVEATP